jgi:glycosyltransferase involved in cell wall biosynthesis
MLDTGAAPAAPSARTEPEDPRPGAALFVFTPTAHPCGVETFTRAMVEALREPPGRYGALAISGRWDDVPAEIAAVARSREVVFNFPLIAWKKLIVQPLLLLFAAILCGRRTSIFLHEWTALHPLRRLVLVPFVVLADTIIVVSPYAGDQLAADRWLGWTARKCRVVPHPVTVLRPKALRTTARVESLARAAASHDLVIGTFGSIYEGKASTALLDVAARLRQSGHRPLLVYVGSFTSSLDNYEAEFRSAVRQRGLDDDVIVTGFIEGTDELFALFEQIGVFLFLFPEGLTARRSSVITTLQSNRPVVVTAPQSMAEFDHHAGWTETIASGAISFLPRDADVGEICDAVLAAARRRDAVPVFDADAWWKLTTDATRAILGP